MPLQHQNNREIARLTPFFFIAGILLFSTMIFSSCGLPSTTIDDLQKAETKRTSTPRQESYDNLLSGQAEDSDGMRYSFSTYKSTDGESISTRSFFGSKTVLEKKFFKSVKQPLNAREIAKSDINPLVKNRAVIYETEGQTKSVSIWLRFELLIVVINTTELQSGLDFEKWYLENHIF